MKHQIKQILFEAYSDPDTKEVAKDMLRGYITIYESPHAVVHDAHGQELLIDAFAEFDHKKKGPDGNEYDWIKFIGDILSGVNVKDFYGQTFNLDSSDVAVVEDELVKSEPIFINHVKRELSNSPHKRSYLPDHFLNKIYQPDISRTHQTT
jgi:hypothetical protein